MKKTSKITSLVMCILMFLTFSVNADGYDILFSGMHSASIEMSAQFKCENLDFINEIPGIEDAESLLDGELFIAATAPKNMTVFATIDATNTIELVPDETDPGYYSATADVFWQFISILSRIQSQKMDGLFLFYSLSAFL